MSHFAGESQSEHGRLDFDPPRGGRTPRLEDQLDGSLLLFRELYASDRRRTRRRASGRFRQPGGSLRDRGDDEPRQPRRLADMPGRWIDQSPSRVRPPRLIVLDMESSVSLTHGTLEATV